MASLAVPKDFQRMTCISFMAREIERLTGRMLGEEAWLDDACSVTPPPTVLSDASSAWDEFESVSSKDDPASCGLEQSGDMRHTQDGILAFILRSSHTASQEDTEEDACSKGSDEEARLRGTSMADRASSGQHDSWPADTHDIEAHRQFVEVGRKAATSAAVLKKPAKSAPQRQPEGSGRPAASRRHWTPEEEERFLTALDRFGPKEAESSTGYGRVSVRLGPGVAEMISIVVGTRSVAQVRSHVQKHYIRKEREAARRIPM